MLGIAIEEIEAWWLGDRTNTLRWSGLSVRQLAGNRCGHGAYRAEKDPLPKMTLDAITGLSSRFDRNYGEGNLDMATDFGENYWRRGARLQEIAQQCPVG